MVNALLLTQGYFTYVCLLIYFIGDLRHALEYFTIYNNDKHYGGRNQEEQGETHTFCRLLEDLSTYTQKEDSKHAQCILTLRLYMNINPFHFHVYEPFESFYSAITSIWHSKIELSLTPKIMLSMIKNN